MAAAGNNPRLTMILARELPDLSGKAERLLMYLTAKWASHHQYIHMEEIFYEGIKEITKKLGQRMYDHFDRTDVQHKIMQMRDKFAKFRIYIKNPLVLYDVISNEVRPLPGYFASFNGLEEPENFRTFREGGFPHYRKCKYVFITCKAALFWGESKNNSCENIERCPSDDEDEGFTEYEESEDETDEAGNDDDNDTEV